MLLEDYLNHVLYDPATGYYAQSKVIGKHADFITAPEISPLFSLCIAQWVVDQWQNAGCPVPINILELGAGHGTMMATILKTLGQVPDLYQNTTTYILDTSAPLKTEQQKNLKNHTVHWIDHISEMKSGFTVILANEFFDALPIQYYRTTDQITQAMSIEGTKMVWVDSSNQNSDTGIFYRSTLYEQFSNQMSDALNRNGGVGLIIDYGNMNPGFTLQAVKDHKKVGLFEDEGHADITHHVDFTYLTKLFNGHGLKTLGPIRQGQFLKELGIEDMVHSLNDSDAYKNQLLAVHRLTGSKEMGELFKVFAIQGGSHAQKP